MFMAYLWHGIRTQISSNPAEYTVEFSAGLSAQTISYFYFFKSYALVQVLKLDKLSANYSTQAESMGISTALPDIAQPEILRVSDMYR